MVSPKSHKLPRVIDPRGTHPGPHGARQPEQLPPFIDPELRGGDLLVVNEHVWHQAPAGTTSDDRCGIFNKYCAADAPPAAGYYPYNPGARDALSDAGKRLAAGLFRPADCDDTVADRVSVGCGLEIPVVPRRGNRSCGSCRAAKAGKSRSRSGWDVGSRIGSLQALVNTQLGLDVPWMSYIEDAEEAGNCRVYGFSDEDMDVDARANGDCDWFTTSELQRRLGESHAICRTVDTWLRSDIVRGKGKACSQMRHQFE